MVSRETQALKGVMELTAHRDTLMGQLRLLIPRQAFGHGVNSHAWQGPAPRKNPLLVAVGGYVERSVEWVQKPARPIL